LNFVILQSNKAISRFDPLNTSLNEIRARILSLVYRFTKIPLDHRFACEQRYARFAMLELVFTGTAGSSVRVIFNYSNRARGPPSPFRSSLALFFFVSSRASPHAIFRLRTRTEIGALLTSIFLTGPKEGRQLLRIYQSPFFLLFVSHISFFFFCFFMPFYCEKALSMCARRRW